MNKKPYTAPTITSTPLTPAETQELFRQMRNNAREWAVAQSTVREFLRSQPNPPRWATDGRDAA